MKPVVRVSNHLLFPGGATRKISRFSQLLYALGVKKTVKPTTPWERDGLTNS